MKIYLVGGAVRDKLLGLPVKDRDWVVTGTTPEHMLNQGFQPVGKDFPVFLHPKTHEEYALARTERKSGHGYTGFTFHTSAEVTLEEDLLRRDLTINAMAEDDNGHIIDPYQGQTDLKNRILRHVSPAFTEDPLRILRVARFAARFHQKGFTVAPDTRQLMQAMVASGEVKHLVPERVWQETHRALLSHSPAVYFQTLMDCGALEIVMPWWNQLLHQHNHVLEALTATARQQCSESIRFSCLAYPYKNTSGQALKQFFRNLCIPSYLAERGLLLFKHYRNFIDTCYNPNAQSLVDFFEQADAFRKPDRFLDVLESSDFLKQASREINTVEPTDNPAKWIAPLLAQCSNIDAKPLVAQGIKGKAVGDALHELRVQALEQSLQKTKDKT
ncbi:Multifunctional CCA protein [invertebrate metagenome]|uniref:Multifunctional CCA protein n=1 Tax=invertebrate metagenome TaxID=1711999 RepID=A0A2H9T746_9ZZZZ